MKSQKDILKSIEGLSDIELFVIDLFCGAGGLSEGVEAARLDGNRCGKVVCCVNHDKNAILSHDANIPDALHFIEDIHRTWSCPKKYLGQRVLIHSSGKPLNYDNFYDSILTNEQLLALPENKEWKDFSFCTGSIIGSVEIIDCVQNHPSIWAEKGVYNWVLANPILYENPIKDVKGKLSFWDYPGIKEVKIECPECGSIEIAVEDYTTAPFPTYLHRCNKCEHVIIESEWKEVKL